LVCALLNPGNFGTIDTARRWQVARSIRLGEPMVTPEDVQQGFGIPGRGGVPQAWYGVGQSLLLLPFDALVDTTVSPLLRRFGLDPIRQKQVAELTVAFLMQTFLTACVLLLAHRVLLTFGFRNTAAVAGSLSLLFATTRLQYVQCAQENELLLALALAALAGLRAWQREERARWVLLAGLACGFAVLMRLTSLLETGVFAFFTIAAGTNLKRFLAWFVPPVVGALLFDRWYQWHRFGELFSTYIGIFGRLNQPPDQPASFPFSYPFWKGFVGTFFSPDKSVLLFDPLLIIVLLLVVRNWRSLDRDLRFLLVCLTLLLVAYAVAYARYFDFGGDVAWGDRFVLLPVQLLCLFAVPLLFRYHWPALWVLVFASVILQVASTVISPNVEVIQREIGYRQGVLWNRAVNIAQIATNSEVPQRFTGTPIEWRTLTYFPFQLRPRFPRIAVWGIAGWTALFLSLPILISALWLQARRQDSSDTK
jgi:4-amino-4-deoxy-L-arabinose transferase-like glycosyltransferase